MSNLPPFNPFTTFNRYTDFRTRIDTRNPLAMFPSMPPDHVNRHDNGGVPCTTCSVCLKVKPEIPVFLKETTKSFEDRIK